jgi:hypothetical protein
MLLLPKNAGACPSPSPSASRGYEFTQGCGTFEFVNGIMIQTDSLCKFYLTEKPVSSDVDLRDGGIALLLYEHSNEILACGTFPQTR